MTPLIICNRVTLLLSSLTISDNSFYRNSNGIAVALPYHYIVTYSFLELCADDYFYLTSQALEQRIHSSDNIDLAYIISIVCSCISIVCLSITITTYLLFEIMRTLPGKINLCLCVSLFMIFPAYSSDLATVYDRFDRIEDSLHNFWCFDSFLLLYVG